MSVMRGSNQSDRLVAKAWLQAHCYSLYLLDEFHTVPDQLPYGLPGSDSLRRIVPMLPGVPVALVSTITERGQRNADPVADGFAAKWCGPIPHSIPICE